MSFSLIHSAVNCKSICCVSDDDNNNMVINITSLQNNSIMETVHQDACVSCEDVDYLSVVCV